jgi:hypothetical protein
MRIVGRWCEQCGSRQRILIKGVEVCAGCGAVDHRAPQNQATPPQPDEEVLEFKPRS